MNISKNNKGFTLIEILITVAIIAIIAAVALPGYQDQVRKARRADVMDLLTDCAAAQARNYSTESPPTYLTEVTLRASDLCNGSGDDANVLLSKDGYYQITTVRNDACTTGATTWCFLLIATPVAGGSQTLDTECQQWTIDHRDNKTANDATNGGGNDTTRQCWRS